MFLNQYDYCMFKLLVHTHYRRAQGFLKMFSDDILEGTRAVPKFRFHFIPQPPAADIEYYDSAIPMIRHMPIANAKRRHVAGQPPTTDCEEADCTLYDYAVFV